MARTSRPKLPRAIALPEAQLIAPPPLQRWLYRESLRPKVVRVSAPMSEERARKNWGPLLIGPAEDEQN
jgi:hypothetical protein